MGAATLVNAQSMWSYNVAGVEVWCFHGQSSIIFKFKKIIVKFNKQDRDPPSVIRHRSQRASPHPRNTDFDTQVCPTCTSTSATWSVASLALKVDQTLFFFLCLCWDKPSVVPLLLFLTIPLVSNTTVITRVVTFVEIFVQGEKINEEELIEEK